MTEKTCAKCGKVFVPAVYHKFRIGDTYWCKWSCYLHRDEKPKKEPTTKMVQIFDEDGSMVGCFRSAREAADTLDLPENSIADACRLERCYKGFYWRYKERDEHEC